MESLTVHATDDYSSIETLYEYIGRRIIVATNDRRYVYVGVLESAALEDTSLPSRNFSAHKESTLTLNFRGRNNSVYFAYDLNAKDPLIVHILPNPSE